MSWVVTFVSIFIFSSTMGLECILEDLVFLLDEWGPTWVSTFLLLRSTFGAAPEVVWLKKKNVGAENVRYLDTLIHYELSQ